MVLGIGDVGDDGAAASKGRIRGAIAIVPGKGKSMLCLAGGDELTIGSIARPSRNAPPPGKKDEVTKPPFPNVVSRLPSGL